MADDRSARTRRRCLDAGVKLFFEQPLRTDPFGSITYADVARRAAITRQGMQNHWKTRAEFNRDLAAYLLGNENLYAEDFQKIQAVVKASSDRPLFDAICEIATADVQSLTDNIVFSSMTTLAVVYVRGDEALTAMARKGYRELDVSTWADIYQSAIERAGRVPREPLDGRSIGMVLQALVEGSGIRHFFDPGVLSERDRAVRSRYGLYALAVASILGVMTRRRDAAGDPETVEGVISNLLER